MPEGHYDYGTESWDKIEIGSETDERQGSGGESGGEQSYVYKYNFKIFLSPKIETSKWRFMRSPKPPKTREISFLWLDSGDHGSCELAGPGDQLSHPLTRPTFLPKPCDFSETGVRDFRGSPESHLVSSRFSFLLGTFGDGSRGNELV